MNQAMFYRPFIGILVFINLRSLNNVKTEINGNILLKTITDCFKEFLRINKIEAHYFAATSLF